MLVLSARSSPAWAIDVPELDPGSMASALTLLGGGLMIPIEHRRQQ